MGNLPDRPIEEKPWCSIHGCGAEICGGPHRVVHTTLGNEVLAPDESPEGEVLE